MSNRDLPKKLLKKYGAESALSLSILGGWYFLTSAIASLAFANAHVVWRLSSGFLLLSLSGWRLLYKIGTRGLYDLTRD